MFILCLEYVIQISMKENGFILKQARISRYPVETIIDVDYIDDLALLPNTSAQAESLLYSVEQAAGGIGLSANASKTEYMCSFNKKEPYPTLSGKPLKLVDQFIYFDSNISSTESDVNIRLAKAWTAIDRLSIIWKFDFSQAVALSLLLYGCTTWTLTKRKI